jgi:hypothetical protein
VPASETNDATQAGRFVGRPSYDEGREVWQENAFDLRERAQAGHRSREWTAVAATELDVLRELTRCLRELRHGRWPE